MDPYYQPGGGGYENLALDYGEPAADRVAAADAAGNNIRFQQVLSDVVRGRDGSQVGSASTFENFWRQITTDPLSAPLDAANDQIGKAVWNVVKNPFVLLALALIVFAALGGFGWLRRRLL